MNHLPNLAATFLLIITPGYGMDAEVKYSSHLINEETSKQSTLEDITLAANQGDAGAQYNLGVMYANGQGVSKDDKEVVRLYTLAATRNRQKPNIPLIQNQVRIIIEVIKKNT